MTWLIISGVVVSILSTFLWRKGQQKIEEVERYHFHNTTNGGVVQFSSYEDSKRMEYKRRVGESLIYIAKIIIGFSIPLIGVPIIMWIAI